MINLYNIRNIFLILLVGIFFSCEEKNKKYYTLDFYNYKETPSDSNVFPENFRPYKLTQGDILICQKLLKKLVEEDNQRIESPIPYDKYGQQYIGALSINDDIIVYINFFCDPENHPLKDKYLVKVSDGGECYFYVKINLTKKEIIESYSNGHA